MESVELSSPGRFFPMKIFFFLNGGTHPRHTCVQKEFKRKDEQLVSERERREALQAEIKALRAQISAAEASAATSDPSPSTSSPQLNSELKELQKELAREAAENEQLMKKAETLLQSEDGERDGTGGKGAGGSGVQGDAEFDEQMKEMAVEVKRREAENDKLLHRVRHLQSEIRCGSVLPLITKLEGVFVCTCSCQVLISVFLTFVCMSSLPQPLPRPQMSSALRL
jgi:alanyl-tRNA synthetase